ncbi:unnamed protein product [Rotaria sordida]|uniref:Uncharacterized protein n=2 Tax=Rotaria sordida TaxID=392033 RepID=A0A814NBU0_9BILA|nr:unnamed protein product [Rotaria sordida]
MEEPLEQEHSITNDDLKPSSSTTTTKSSRSTKPTTTNGTIRRHKRRRQTNSTRSSSDHSTSSSRSSSSSSASHSSHLSIKNSNLNEQEIQKTRSYLAQEQLQTIINKTKTGKYDVLDSFAFLSFETDDDWRIALEHFNQQHLQRTYTTKKSYSLSGKKNGNNTDHIDVHSLQRSTSVPCKIEDGQSISNNSTSNPIEEISIENHRSSMWQNTSPNKNSNDRSSSITTIPPTTTIKTEPIDQTNRTTSEHEENHIDNEQNQNSITSSALLQKSKDDIKIIEPNNEKKHHHHHHHHHHKSHKRHKTKHDLSINGDSSNKHPTITSMSDLAKQHIKHEPISLPSSLNFPPHFDPKLFPMPSFTPFPHPPPQSQSPFPGSYDQSLMLASRLYSGQYPRDLLMPPPSRPPSRSLQHPFSLKDNISDTTMEKMFEKYYPGVLPSYLAAAASAAAAVSSNSNSPVSSLNVKMHGTSPNGPDHPLWSHRESLQRQYLSTTNKQSSTKSPLFDTNTKLSSNHSSTSPIDNNHHHHHHRRHSSSTSNTDISNSTTPSNHPLYLAPVIVTEFHQHQHNHNHTHEHKLNITTKDDRQLSPRSKTPSLSNENKKMKTSFSVTDMFIDKTSPVIKHSQQQQQQQQQGFLSVINNKKDTNQTSSIQLKKPSNGKWSTAHIHIAWMIFNHEQRQREKLNLNQANKIRPPSQSTLLPPPLPLNDNNNDLSLLRPPPPPPPPPSTFPFPFPFDINNSQQNSLLRSTSTAKLPRPTVSSSSSSSTPSSIKTSTIKREQKIPFIDERIRHTPPSPLSRPTSSSNFLPSSPSHRMKMDFPSLLLPPPPPSQHQLSTFSLNDDRKRFLTQHTDLLSPFGGPPPPPSPFLSTFFPMGAPPMPPPPIHSSSSRRSGINSDSPKSSLFPPPIDFIRSPLLPSGFPLPNNHLESDRYRFILEQHARERDIQYAMMAAAASGNAPPPQLFTDPNSSALFKHYSN